MQEIRVYAGGLVFIATAGGHATLSAKMGDHVVAFTLP
jgi:glucose dehydrogenase